MQVFIATRYKISQKNEETSQTGSLAPLISAVTSPLETKWVNEHFLSLVLLVAAAVRIMESDPAVIVTAVPTVIPHGEARSGKLSDYLIKQLIDSQMLQISFRTTTRTAPACFLIFFPWD